MSKKTCLVIGATGTVGRSVLHHLHARGIAATAAVRSLDRVPQSASTGVVFDFAKPDTFAPALAGHDRVFLLGPPLVPDLDALLQPFIDFLAAQGPRHVVYLSNYGADDAQGVTFHLTNEQRLKKAPQLTVTILRPGFFTQNFANYSRPDIEERGVLFFPAGSGKTPFIDTDDIGRCVAAIVSDDRHSGQTYTLTGPESWSMAEVASTLTKLLGRTITDAAPTPEIFRTTLIQAQVPAFIPDYLISVYDMIARGVVARVTDDVYRLTGHPPRKPAAVLAEQFGPGAKRSG